jgi:ferredoxin-NADP reductase
MKFTLSAIKQEASDTFSFVFAPEQALQWKAGQLLRYVLNHANPDDRGVERFFSIASAPHEKHVMVTTRFAPKSSSFKKALKNLRPGDAIEAHDLEGDFAGGRRARRDFERGQSHWKEFEGPTDRHLRCRLSRYRSC